MSTGPQRPASQSAPSSAASTGPRDFREINKLFKAWFDKARYDVQRGNLNQGVSLADAEDIVMDAFTDLLRAMSRAQGSREYSYAYLRTAAISHVIKHKKKLEKEQGLNGGQPLMRLDECDDDSRMPGAEDPRLSEAEVTLWRDEIFSGLTPKQRAVMECHVADLDDTETAQTLGMTSEAVRQSRSAARKSLVKIMRSDGQYRDPAALAKAQRTRFNRDAERALAAAESLTAPQRDLRSMEPDERAESMAKVAELERFLQGSRAGAFGAEGSAAILKAVASLAKALVSDRNEPASLTLIRSAWPHLEFADSGPSAFDLLRIKAEALCEIGHPEKAIGLLRDLSSREKRTLGSVTPRTAMLFFWAQSMAGQASTAEKGFSALKARLAELPADAETLLHVECRHNWVRGQARMVSESASGYDSVISERIRRLGRDHADALDARHSKEKMLVVNGAGAQAVANLWAVAEDRARIQGARHPDTLESVKYAHLAHVQEEPRDARVRRDAIIALEEIFQIQEAKHGKAYPTYRDTADWLGVLQGK